MAQGILHNHSQCCRAKGQRRAPHLPGCQRTHPDNMRPKTMTDHATSPAMHLYQSNRLEILFAALCDCLAQPLDNPLVPEIIVVQNPGMARWLAQQIALRTGIAANLSFPLPASFFWSIFQTTLGELPDLSHFDRSLLLWRIMAGLDSLLEQADMATIAGYLSDDQDGCKKYQLAEKIAETLDQYMVYRPEMLLSWEQGKESHWQATLWRSLCEGKSPHRASLLKQFTQAADAGTLQTETLPQRIAFFGINSLAPAYMQIIDLLKTVTEVHVFHLSPCQEAWGDILPERQLAMERKKWREQKLDDLSEYYESGNPLLASMGATGKEFFNLLMQLDPEEHALYQPPEQSTLLGMIQSDILTLHNRTATEQPTLFPSDDSIRFHCCHSPMREVQVLHDRLLDLFGADPKLKPADVLVMAPDINTYAPFVNGVFGAAEDDIYIPWSIADRKTQAEQPVLEGFLSLLESLSGRFTAPEITAFFDNPSIARKYKLSEDELSILRNFIKKSGIRWGLDRQQRGEQHLEAPPLHTWEFGIDRLLMSYITGPLDTPCLDILPCDNAHNSTTSWLGSLADFFHKLQQLYQSCRLPHPAAAWEKILLTLLDDFFDTTENSPDHDILLLLREKICMFADQCAQAGYTMPLELSVVRHHFKTLLQESSGGQSFIAGKITFCNMVPMRSIPFKVIWLLGMNDTAYPRTQRAPGFDLIAKHPRLGDRSRRDDDRYLFLESLISARKHFAVSWIGRDLHTNQSLPPSVVVAELRDYLDRGWSLEENTPVPSERLTTEYPLQPFSSRNFNGDPATRSYTRLWLPTTNIHLSTLFLDKPLALPDPTAEAVQIRQLLKFWNHPVRYFLEQRLGLGLFTRDDILPENEPFSLDSLQTYLTCENILAKMLDEQSLEPVFELLLAEGEFPVGSLGLHTRRDITARAGELLTSIRELIRTPVKPVDIDLTIDGIRMTGSISSLYASGFVSFRPGQCKGKDLMRLWINHLLLNLVQPDGVSLHSHHAATDKCVFLRPVDRPEKELAPLLRYFLQGQQEPLHFYPQTSYCWAEEKNEEKRMKKAAGSWYPSYNRRGEGEEQAYTIGLRGHEPLDNNFAELATLFLPVVQTLEDCLETA
ncbi:MAG: exodeoxyribonuclease V subunit gamma [Desulfobulbus sp.]|nr:MAG: exodeoxyribonuclease V subunit gamma [Desulfobulbus sp.]